VTDSRLDIAAHVMLRLVRLSTMRRVQTDELVTAAQLVASLTPSAWLAPGSSWLS
jgi:hypothetical protein